MLANQRENRCLAGMTERMILLYLDILSEFVAFIPWKNNSVISIVPWKWNKLPGTLRCPFQSSLKCLLFGVQPFSKSLQACAQCFCVASKAQRRLFPLAHSCLFPLSAYHAREVMFEKFLHYQKNFAFCKKIATSRWTKWKHFVFGINPWMLNELSFDFPGKWKQEENDPPLHICRVSCDRSWQIAWQWLRPARSSPPAVLSYSSHLLSLLQWENNEQGVTLVRSGCKSVASCFHDISRSCCKVCWFWLTWSSTPGKERSSLSCSVHKKGKSGVGLNPLGDNLSCFAWSFPKVKQSFFFAKLLCQFWRNPPCPFHTQTIDEQ